MKSATRNRFTMRLGFYIAVIVSLSLLMIGWWIGSGQNLGAPGERLNAVGRLFGLLAAWCIILEVVLMSRIPFIERSFDLHDNIDLHHLTGYAILFTISGHVVFQVLGYAAPTHIGLWTQFLQFNTSQYEDVLLATIGTIIFFGASALSVYVIRSKIRYEIWYLTHLAIYGAILMTFLHQIKTGADFIDNFWFTAYWYGLYFLAFALWLWYRVLRPFALLGYHQFRVAAIEQTAINTYSVTIEGRHMENFSFLPGQYATWRFLSSNLWFEAHPFSFSSTPGNQMIRLTMKAGPEFMDKILNLTIGTYIMVDGPRGSFTVDRAEKTSKVVLIAGGIGIAPYLASIETLLAQGKQVTLLYGVQVRDNIAFMQELRLLQSNGLYIDVFVDENGQRITHDILQRFAQPDTTIFICGPDAMSVALNNTLKQLGFPASRIITERFAF